MVSVQRSFYFILLLFFNVGSINSAQLKIQTLDFLTGEPVPGVDVILRHRLITNDDDGESHLEPLDLNPILSSARTDTAGFAPFELDLDSSTFLVIELSPRDHESQTLTLLPINPSDRIDRTFRLLPRDPTTAQAGQIIDLHESERAAHVVEQGPFV
ncbi:MAG TPA: hypothetical protein VFG14_01635, partial [Chthoniobacteraceae bacterium]|nr:hypothetical protein [Chthoniobacteraceae bacterium]